MKALRFTGIIMWAFFWADFYDISEETMDFAMNYYMRLNWEDPKLTFANIGSRNSIMLDPLDIRGKAGERKQIHLLHQMRELEKPNKEIKASSNWNYHLRDIVGNVSVA